MSIRTSSANTDPFKDDLTCVLNSYSLNEQIFAMQNIRGALGQNAFILSQDRDRPAPTTGIGMQTMPNYKCLESITFDYNVKWPLTLIINRRAITKY